MSSGGVLPRVDRLTLDGSDSGDEEVIGVEQSIEMPEEELLRLDDGTRLPAELTELRSLLELHSMAAGTGERVAFDADNIEGQNADGCDSAARDKLAALAAAKAEALSSCLLGFDEGILLLHDKVLDHEALCRRLAAIRRRQRQAPPGRYHYDETVMFDDDVDGSAVDAEDSALDVADLLTMDRPGGAGERASDWTDKHAGKHAGSSDDDYQPHEVAQPLNDEDDEETLDQRVAHSRQQIKTWLRALERGERPNQRKGEGDATTRVYSKRSIDLPSPAGAASAAGRTGVRGVRGVLARGGLSTGTGVSPEDTLVVSPDDQLLVEAQTPRVQGATALPPVVPPPRARRSGYSTWLRGQTATWGARSFK